MLQATGPSPLQPLLGPVSASGSKGSPEGAQMAETSIVRGQEHTSYWEERCHLIWREDDNISVQLCKRSLPGGGWSCQAHSRSHGLKFQAEGTGREGGVRSGTSQGGFHCPDPFWGCSAVNEQLRSPGRIPSNGIVKRSFNIILEKCSEQS